MASPLGLRAAEMQFLCLCPTYGRPSLVANSLALFLGQQLPASDTAHLLIFDDAGQITRQAGVRGSLSWSVISARSWLPLQRKYDVMVGYHNNLVGNPSVGFVVWDDDDVYLPWHLAAHGAALSAAVWSHPSRAWSTYGIDSLRDPPRAKVLHGRSYHGALAIRGDFLERLSQTRPAGHWRNYWPGTDRSDYDKQQLADCHKLAGVAGDPCEAFPPSYVYRWQDTGRDHCSARIVDGKYRPPRIQEPGMVTALLPILDLSSRALLNWSNTLKGTNDEEEIPF